MHDRSGDAAGKSEASGVNFDWDAAEWQETGRGLLDLAASASGDWGGRRPSPIPDSELIARFRQPLPQAPIATEMLVSQLKDLVASSAYNGHPRWLAYITASPVPIGVLGDMVASALNQNTALWRLAPGATTIELQTIDWIKEMLGYPASAEGIFVSGGQLSNVVAHAVARDFKAPWDVRQHGLRGPNGDAPRLRIYGSAEIHYCHQQAADLLGMGRDAVRLVPVDDNYRMRTDALKKMIAEDRAQGDLPIMVIGNAGTVAMGAVDPLGELAAIARAEDLWFHIDGAYGAFANIAASRPQEFDAMGEADSLSCDPHKWLYSPIGAGVTLVREPGLLDRAFEFHASYLETEVATREVDLLERSPENTRPFRALKVWLALQHYGLDGYREMIERNIQLAAHMERLVEETPGLSVVAPRELSIVCWRAEPAGVTDAEKLEELQTRVIEELEARGIAMVSNAKLADGRTALRGCIVNFRTTEEDVEAIVQASAAIAEELAGG